MAAEGDGMALFGDPAFGVLDHDFRSGSTTVSDGLLALLEIGRAQVPRDAAGWRALLGVDRAACRGAWRAARAQAGEGWLTVELRPRVAGRERILRVTARLVPGGAGRRWRPERLVAVLVDRTQAEVMQAALAQAQRLETAGRIAGMVAHDFNNILTVILGNLELAEPKVSDAAARAFLRGAIAATGMGAGVNRRLLALVGGRGGAEVCLDLDVHLGQTWDIYRRVLRDGIRLRFAPGSAGAQVCADPAEIDAALLNLVVNARDVQAEGGRIVIATQRVTAAEAGIGAGGADGFVRICVCDDGPGLPAAMIARLGEPFVTTKPVGCGSGLGLASVMATARRAGGMFRIDSGPQGTKASLFLPIRPGPAEGAAPEAAALPMGRGERVLVVEDDPMVRDVARLRLEALGYQVAEASGAEMALRQVAAGLRVDLVLADVVPAGGDWGRCSGWALVQDLRALRPGLGAVLASGHAGTLPGDGWAGAVMLEKPYSLCDLARAVRRGLDPAGQTTGRTTAAKT